MKKVLKWTGLVLALLAFVVGTFFAFREYPLAFVAIVGIVGFFVIAKLPRPKIDSNDFENIKFVRILQEKTKQYFAIWQKTEKRTYVTFEVHYQDNIIKSHQVVQGDEDYQRFMNYIVFDK